MNHSFRGNSERSRLIGECVQTVVDLDESALRGFLQFVGLQKEKRNSIGLRIVDFTAPEATQGLPLLSNGGDNKIAVSVLEASKLIGVGQATAWRLAVRGEIPSVKVGRRRIIPLDKLREWANSQTGIGTV